MKTLPVLDQGSVDRAKFVTALTPPAHIHISGVCGTGTAAVLSLLKQLGFIVTGSDKAFYPPMGKVVKDLADKVFEGYSVENLKPHPALVVIGNSLSRGNPEVEYVLENNLPYASMPEVFSALLVGSRAQCGTSVVVIGTHGKTTTTAMIATLLEKAGRKPGYFIGGVPKNLSQTIRPVDKTLPLQKRVVVFEGDEYDSAFFAKWPKFHSYRPDLLVITSLEFDHGDIYESVEQIEEEFRRVVARVPKEGRVFVWDGDPRLEEAVKKWKNDPEISAQIFFYGEKATSFSRLVSREQHNKEKKPIQKLALQIEKEKVEIKTELTGQHNALNFTAACAVGKVLGLTVDEIRLGLEAFTGVLRRQQVFYLPKDIVVVEDFAHHPTAVGKTLQGIKESFPTRRLIAVYEPRSNTSRRSFFQNEYQKSFSVADTVILREVKEGTNYSATSTPVVPLDVKALVTELKSAGKEAFSFEAIDEIKNYLLSELRSGDLVVIMSNGDFGGLLAILLAALK